jgi:hypothetical protein
MFGKRSAKTEAMLAHLATGGDDQDFAGTKYENAALARTLHSRGLIAWDGERNRYTLTPAGWRSLAPRRFGLPALAASAAVGAIAVAAIAVFWLPGARSQNSAHDHASTTLAVQGPAPAPASVPAETGGRNVAPGSAGAPQAAPAPRASAAAPPMPPVTPLDLTEVAPPAPEQPSAETAPASAKQAAVKKQPRRTARPAEQHNGLSNFFANLGRTRETTQTRPREVTQTRGRESSQTRSGLGSWFRI